VELERRNQISIPNQALRLAVEKLALYADIQPLMDEMVRALQLLSNRDAMGMDEKHVKVLLLTLLYQTQIYLQLPEITALQNLVAWLLITDGEIIEAVKLV